MNWRKLESGFVNNEVMGKFNKDQPQIMKVREPPIKCFDSSWQKKFIRILETRNQLKKQGVSEKPKE